MTALYLEYGTIAATVPQELLATPEATTERPRTRTSDAGWRYGAIFREFGRDGCSVKDCVFHVKGDDIYKCALNLSDAIILAGYNLPDAKDVNRCPHRRIRNADGMARVTREALGPPLVRGWSQKPQWQGVVYFEGGPSLSGATGHIDLWDGSQGVHAQYPDARTVWFFRLPE